MTSSSKHLKPGQQFWDATKHEFKSYDPFCEPSLVSILFLAYGNHEITKLCLESTQKALLQYTGELEFCFLENGLDDNNWSLFQQFPCQRKKLIRSSNWGIMSAMNDLWSVSRGEYCLILENDFWNSKSSFNFLQTAKDILDEKSEVGMVHLRAINDPYENWGWGKLDFNPFSTGDYWAEYTKSGHKYFIADYPNKYNNNPNLMRKTLWRECGHFSEPIVGSCPKHDETHWQTRVNATDCVAAHIASEVYIHVGGYAKQKFLKNNGNL
jgi:hypothetical protein